MVQARYDFEFFPGKCPENGHNAPKARYDWSCYWKCQISLSHGPETVENTEDFTRLPKSRLLLGQRGKSLGLKQEFSLEGLEQRQSFQNHVSCFFFTLDFRTRHMDDVHRTTQKVPHFAVNHAWNQNHR